MSRTDALPVHYVFPRQKLDVNEAGRALLEASSELAEGSHKGVMVVWDVSFDWLSGTSDLAHGHVRQTLLKCEG
jgi:diphthamide biosynthesis protein 2